MSTIGASSGLGPSNLPAHTHSTPATGGSTIIAGFVSAPDLEVPAQANALFDMRGQLRMWNGFIDEFISLGANQNNYEPVNPNGAGFGSETMYAIKPTIANVNITGFDADFCLEGYMFWIFSRPTTTNTITLKHASASSLAGNRIICPGYVDLVLSGGNGALMWYKTIDGFDRFYVLATSAPVASSGWAGPTVIDTSISANQNNWNPAGLSTASKWAIINLDMSSANRTITGIVPPGDPAVGFMLDIAIVGGDLTLPHQSGSSSGANTFFLPGGVSATILNRKGIRLISNNAGTSGWRIAENY